MRCSDIKPALPKTMTTYASQEQIKMILRRVAYAESKLNAPEPDVMGYKYWAGEFVAATSILGILGVGYLSAAHNTDVFQDIKHG